MTGLRPVRRRSVLVEIDGVPWRTLPEDVVVRALLRVGEELDRPRLRELGRELRRAQAVDRAARVLRHRDASARALAERLDRAGVAARDRDAALESLRRAGVVDDSRFAGSRARLLAERAWGDEAILHDLERQGVEDEAAAAAVAALEPERDRAARVVARRGRGAKTARYLSGRGFGADAVEAALGAAVADGA